MSLGVSFLLIHYLDFNPVLLLSLVGELAIIHVTLILRKEPVYPII